MSHFARLPLELTELITEFLGPDKQALSACGLTCRGWVPASRRLLYKKISLPFHLPLLCSEDAQTLLSILASPYCTIKPYVRSFHTTYVSSDTALSLFRQLSGFPAVRSLQVGGDVTEDTARALLSTFGGVEELRFIGANLPSSFTHFIEGLPSLKSLELVNSNWKQSANDHPPPVGLRAVVISMKTTSFLKWLSTSPSEHRHMRLLNLIAICPEDAAALGLYLPLLLHLRDFTLNISKLSVLLGDYPEAADTFTRFMDLGVLSELRTLTIIDGETFAVSALFALLPALAISAPLEHLERVTLVICVRFLNPSRMPWRALAAVFPPQENPGLRELAIELRGFVGADSQRTELIANIRSELREINSRGILSVSV